MQLGKRHLRVVVPILVVLGLSGCSKDDDDDVLPLGDATSMRGLPFKTTPRSKHIDRNEYLEDARNQYANADDAWVKETFDHFGRLGFFSKPDDIRSSGGTSETLTAAFYSPATKAITILGKPPKEIVVHELVHALQDQHFDLVALENAPMTTDEDAALQATIEGDATLSQYRFHVDEQHADALATARANLTAERVLQASESTLAEAKEQPLYFYGHWGLNYSYGLGYVAGRAGIFDGNWNTSAIDPLFGDQKPHTTREVLNRSAPEPVPSVGLGELPTSVAADLDVVLVDRLGQWHTYLLLVPSAPSHEAMQSTTQGWSADQLVVLRERSRVIPPPTDQRTGVLWTSLWRTEDAASSVVTALAALHRIPGPGKDLPAGGNGEPITLERRGTRVVFAKNLASEAAQALVDAAFGEAPAIPPSGFKRGFLGRNYPAAVVPADS